VKRAKKLSCQRKFPPLVRFTLPNIPPTHIIAGRPPPDVSWFMNGKLVDDEFEHSSGNIIENRLLWPSLQRHDLFSVFTCSAINTKTVAPREKRLVLDMYRKF
jgi:hypothetical protein